MPRVLWMKTKTTGLDANECAVCEVSLIVEEDTKIIDTLDIMVRPEKGMNVSIKALEINNITLDELRNDPKFISYLDAYGQVVSFLKKNKPENGKYILAGKCLSFDLGFMESFFRKNGDTNLTWWFQYVKLDLDVILAEEMILTSHQLKSFKLDEVIKTYEYDIDANSMTPSGILRKIFWDMKGIDVNV